MPVVVSQFMQDTKEIEFDAVAQYRVCLVQTGERELGSFHTDPVNIECRLVRLAVWSTQHDAGCGFNEVAFQYFGNKRE